MITNYFGRSTENTPNSAIASLTGSYAVPHDTVIDCTFALAPRSAIDALPSAAIIYQVSHGRETGLINEYQALQVNWDGYDADPISESACTAAKTFLVSLPSNFESPDLCPNASGTISMEWESAGGRAQLELGKSKFSFYLRQKGAATVYQKGDAKMASSVCALLAMLYNVPRPTAITSIGY